MKLTSIPRFRPALRRTLILVAAACLASAASHAATPAPAVPDQLDLKTAVGFALNNNFAILQARERIRQQEGVVTEVASLSIPNVAAAASYQRNAEALGQSLPPSDRSWALNITASQAVFSGGSIRSSMKSSRLTREAAVLDLKSTINDALLNVRIGFYNVLLARAKITVQEQNLALLQQQLQTATDRVQAGTTSPFEQLRAQVAVENARVPLITSRNDFLQATESLRQTLGFTTNTRDSLRKLPDFTGALEFTPANFDLQTAFDAAHVNRPDLVRLSKLADSREEAVTTARSGYFPNVAVVGGWELFKGPTNSFSDSRDGLFIGLQSQWNLFDGKATAGRVAQARSAVAQARLLVTEAQLAVEVEVRSDFYAFQEASELADVSSRVVGQAEEAARLALARYNAGTATQLDVQQSQLDLTTARTNQLQAYYSYNVAVARLRKAMGLSDDLVTLP